MDDSRRIEVLERMLTRLKGEPAAVPKPQRAAQPPPGPATDLPATDHDPREQRLGLLRGMLERLQR